MSDAAKIRRLKGLLEEVIAATAYGEPPFEFEQSCVECDKASRPKDVYEGPCLYHEIMEAIGT